MIQQLNQSNTNEPMDNFTTFHMKNLNSLATDRTLFTHCSNQAIQCFLKQDHFSCRFLSTQQINDPELRPLLLNSILNSQVTLNFFTQNCPLVNDYEIVLRAVTKNGLMLRYAGKALRQDRNEVLSAATQNACALQFAPTFKSDRPFIESVVKMNGLALEHASKSLKSDREVVLAAVTQDGMAIHHAAKQLRMEREVLLVAVQSSEQLFCQLYDENKNKRMVVELVSQKGSLLKVAPDVLRNDREVVLAAIGNDVTAFAYASGVLKNDREVLIAVLQIELRNDKRKIERATQLILECEKDLNKSVSE